MGEYVSTQTLVIHQWARPSVVARTRSSFFFGKVTALGVLCLVVCLTLLASSFLPSASLINMYMYVHVYTNYIYICVCGCALYYVKFYGRLMFPCSQQHICSPSFTVTTSPDRELPFRYVGIYASSLLLLLKLFIFSATCVYNYTCVYYYIYNVHVYNL